MFKRSKKQTPEPPSRRSPSAGGPPVFSYYARGGSSTGQNTGRGNHERDEEAKKQRLPRPKIGSVPAILAVIAIVGILLYSLWIQPRPNIVVLSQQGTVYQDSSAYQKAINEAWGGQLGNQFKMSVDAVALQNKIAEAVPDAANVQVQLPLLGRKPTVVITPGTPVLELVTIDGNYFVDKNGKVLANVAQVKQNQLKNVPTVLDESGVKAEPGKTILTIEQAEYIHALSRQLAADGLEVQSMTLPANAANEVDVRLKGQNYYIKFATTGEARQGVGAYLAVKNKFESEGVKPSEYVDVRIDEKVFYK